MAMPLIEVYIYFDGVTATDVSDRYVSIDIDRGRSRELDEFVAGSATVALRNHDRAFDSLYTTGLYYGNVKPGKRLQVVAAGIVQIDGKIDDWDLSHTLGSTPLAVVKVFDALGALAKQKFNAWTTTAGQTAGPRLTAVLARPEVNYTGTTEIGTGVSTLQADNVSADANVLNYAQLVALSDLGRFFASRTNVVTFRDRHYGVNSEADLMLVDTAQSVLDGAALLRLSTLWLDVAGPRFRPRHAGESLLYEASLWLQIEAPDADAAEAVRPHGYGRRVGTENLFNRVSVDREGGIRQTSSDATSIAEYEERPMERTGLLLDSDSQSADMADWLLGIYKDPEDRISEIRVIVSALDKPDQPAVLSLDLDSIVRAIWTPGAPPVGDPIDQYLFVEGLNQTISGSRHELTIHCGQTANRSAFILEDDVFGILEGPGVLSF